MGLVIYNILSVVKAAVCAAHGKDAGESISTYYMADEIAGTYRGMMIAVGEKYWTQQYASLTATQMARTLIVIAKRIRLSRYAKNPWQPKKKPDKKMSKKNRNHVSTARILKKRNQPSYAVEC